MRLISTLHLASLGLAFLFLTQCKTMGNASKTEAYNDIGGIDNNDTEGWSRIRCKNGTVFYLPISIAAQVIGANQICTTTNADLVNLPCPTGNLSLSIPRHLIQPVTFANGGDYCAGWKGSPAEGTGGGIISGTPQERILATLFTNNFLMAGNALDPATGKKFPAPTAIGLFFASADCSGDSLGMVAAIPKDAIDYAPRQKKSCQAVTANSCSLQKISADGAFCEPIVGCANGETLTSECERRLQ